MGNSTHHSVWAVLPIGKFVFRLCFDASGESRARGQSRFPTATARTRAAPLSHDQLPRPRKPAQYLRSHADGSHRGNRRVSKLRKFAHLSPRKKCRLPRHFAAGPRAFPRLILAIVAGYRPARGCPARERQSGRVPDGQDGKVGPRGTKVAVEADRRQRVRERRVSFGCGPSLVRRLKSQIRPE
jgi:hypothetical protein